VRFDHFVRFAVDEVAVESFLCGENDQLSGVTACGLCWTTGHYDEPTWRMVGFGFGKSGPIARIRCRVDAILAAGRSLISAQTPILYLLVY